MIKNKSIITIILFLTICICIIPINQVMASTPGDSGVVRGEDTSLNLGDLNKYASDGGSSESFDKIINNVVQVIQVVASIVSVAVLIVLGIKYMIGSVEEKAEYKKTMIPYLVGAFLVFGIANITSMLYNIAKNII